MAGSDTRVLVLGATGMLGHAALEVLGVDFDVHGTVRDAERARRLGVTGALHELDARHPEGLPALLEQVRPDVVLNAVGIVKQREEAGDPAVAIPVNGEFPHLAARACRDAGARFVHVSTDCVFSGRLPAPGRYTEDDPADPPDLYGRSKLGGEVRAEGALTLRTSIFGWELETRHGLLEWLVGQAGRTVDGYANAIFSGLETRALARVVGAVIREAPDLSGLYHVAAEPVSKLALLDNLNRALALDCEVRPVQDPVVNRALDPSRFEAHTRIPIPAWSSMIEDCARAAR